MRMWFSEDGKFCVQSEGRVIAATWETVLNYLNRWVICTPEEVADIMMRDIACIFLNDYDIYLSVSERLRLKGYMARKLQEQYKPYVYASWQRYGF